MKRTFVVSLFLGLAVQLRSQSNTAVTVNINDIKATVLPTVWGIFFEDINFAANGGIYAEPLSNEKERS